MAFLTRLSNPPNLSDLFNSRWFINDFRLTEAVFQVQKDYCKEYENKGDIKCSVSETVIGDILLTYIALLTDEKTKKEFPKSFYDEYIDRKDPYRDKLVKTVAKKLGQDESLTLAVLVALYWATAQKRLKTSAILKPAEVGITHDQAEYGTAIIAPIIKTGRNLVDATGKLLGSAADGTVDTISAIGTALKFLPWIIGGIGAVMIIPIVTPALLGAKSAVKALSGGKK